VSSPLSKRSAWRCVRGLPTSASPVTQRLRRLRIAASIAGLALAVLVGVGAQMAPADPSRTVSCREVILAVKFPYKDSYRLVLGVVSAPPTYLRQVLPSGNEVWPFHRKAGLVVTGRVPVRISVPKAWRSRVAIMWGNKPGFFRSLRIAGCPPQQGVRKGRAYAGGFYLKSRAACVPLIFQVGKRTATVRFGLGRACR
jgi:hypothetical protein